MQSEIHLAKPPKGSKTPLKEHLLQVYKQTGKLPQMLKDQPVVDAEMTHLLDWYLEVRGPSPLSYTEIRNWCYLVNLKLLPYEVKIIMQLDNIYWEHIANE